MQKTIQVNFSGLVRFFKPTFFAEMQALSQGINPSFNTYLRALTGRLCALKMRITQCELKNLDIWQMLW